MIGKFITGKTAVFIDAANIFYSQKTLGWRFDYTKFLLYLKKECDVVVARYYTGKVGALEKQNAFLKKLELAGFGVLSKEVKFIKVGHDLIPKGNLDIELALDAYRMSDKYDTLLLCSGDSDFSYLLDLLKGEGKRVIVLSTRGHISRELLERAKYIDISKLRKYVEYETSQKPDKPALEV